MSVQLVSSSVSGNGCLSELSELSELDSELEWCLDKGWNSGLPERTPLCTAGCEGFLHLPLPGPQQQTFQQGEEPLWVLGIDLRALDDTLETRGNFRSMIKIFSRKKFNGEEFYLIRSTNVSRLQQQSRGRRYLVCGCSGIGDARLH